MTNRLTEQLAHGRRVLAAGVGFAAFGLIALVLGFALIPLASVGERDPVKRQLRAQRVLHRAARPYLALVGWLGFFRVVGHETGRLAEPGPKLVVANHPTLLDIVVLLSLMPQADCIVNAGRADNAFLQRMIRACGYIRNDGGRQLLEECCRRLDAGRSLIVFPEGTRSPSSSLGFLHRGAAHIALATGIEPLPVVMRCDPPGLGKGQKWYDVPRRMVHTVSVGEPIAVKPILDRVDSGLSKPVAARQLTAQLRETMLKGLEPKGLELAEL